MMRLFLIPALLICLSFPALAQDEENDPRVVKDSIYFTMDDGVMTLDEMKEETRYIHGKCMNHLYQNTYFDCACIAGAFLNEREKRGPMVLQETILTELYRTGGETTAKCGNAPVIAGAVYNDCMEYSRVFRRLENNNEQYCQCAGNRVARDFSEYPYLRTAYIERLRVNAMLTCGRQFPSVRDNY